MTHPPTAGGLCRSLAEAAVHARRPFMPHLVQAKIQSVDRDNRFADIAYYIDARAVMDRLNVLLPGRWHATYELVDRQPAAEQTEPLLVYRCRLSVAEATYTDVGEGPDHKAAQSDALKRAAVHIGIGHCVYRIEGPCMFPGDRPHELRRSRRGRFYLDEANHAWLRDRYRAWLIQHGVAEYGMPLDHGAVARALAPDLFPDRFMRRNGNGTMPGAETSPAAAPATGVNGRLAIGTPATNGKPAADAGPTANGGPEPNGLPRKNGTPPPAVDPPTSTPDTTSTVSSPTVSSGVNDGAPETKSTAETRAERHVPAPRPTPELVPASPERRLMVIDAAGQRGYRRATVLTLAEVVATTTFDRLDARGLRDLLAFVDSAAGGGVSDTELAAKLDELRRGGNRAYAREHLAVWLLDREEQAAAAP
jgi:hypothetical protein